MGHEDIVVGRQWTEVETLRELDKLEAQVKRFLSHTARTLAVQVEPRGIFGWMEEGADPEVRHPMAHFLNVMNDCREGCYTSYGQQIYKHEEQLKLTFNTEEDSSGDTT